MRCINLWTSVVQLRFRTMGLTGTAALLLAILPVTGQPVASTQPTGWQPNPAVLTALESKNTKWVYREAEVPAYTLPEALVCADGTKVTTRQQWEQKRRPETLELFEKYEFGRSPKAPADVRFEVLETKADALEGAATLKRVSITSIDAGKSFAFSAAVLIPNKRPTSGRAPALLLINHRNERSGDPTRQSRVEFWPAEEIIARGYAAAIFQAEAVDPDNGSTGARAKGVRGVFAGPGNPEQDAWATIAAWAWGASRVMDYLQTDTQIDATRVGVVGHSRGGKAALWAGATDQRFALVMSNSSGRGGASLTRRKLGESLRIINERFPYWFNANYKKYIDRENELPFDQHQLLALIAPRALYVASSDADMWADQRGEFLSLVQAGPVYGLYGAKTFAADAMPELETPLTNGSVGYHIRRGEHDLKLYDWQRVMDFADKIWTKPKADPGKP